MAGGAVLVIGGRKTALHGKVGHGTNNEAEYEGLILGLEAALSAGATTVTVHGDSQLVIRQLEGRYAVKASNLQPLFGKAKRMLQRFDRVAFDWVRRGDNAEADQAANDALDGAS